MRLLIKLHILSYILNYLKIIKEPEVVPVKMSTEICTFIILCDSCSLLLRRAQC
jgi:hypothetical protein